MGTCLGWAWRPPEHLPIWLLQVTLEEGRHALDAVIAEVSEILVSNDAAEVSLQELPDYCKGDYTRTVAGSDGGRIMAGGEGGA